MWKSMKYLRNQTFYKTQHDITFAAFNLKIWGHVIKQTVKMVCRKKYNFLNALFPNFIIVWANINDYCIDDLSKKFLTLSKFRILSNIYNDHQVALSFHFLSEMYTFLQSVNKK